MKIIAAATDKRPTARPDLPTIAESGVPGFQTSAWFALWGPPNMPPDLISKLHADVSKALDLPQTKEFFAANSFERVDLSPAEFARFDRHRPQALEPADSGGGRQDRMTRPT